jgi:hypothetical protein
MRLSQSATHNDFEPDSGLGLPRRGKFNAEAQDGKAAKTDRKPSLFAAAANRRGCPKTSPRNYDSRDAQRTGTVRGPAASGSSRLPPAAADPNVAVAVSPPMAAYPNSAGPGPSHIAATDPYPAAVPGPIARRPDIIGSGSDRNDLDLRCRRGGGSHDDRLRGRSRLRRHRSRRRLLPIRGGRGRSSSCPRVGERLGRRRIGQLADVSRLNAIHRHIFNPALRATRGQRSDTRESQARGPYVSFH